MLSSSYMITSCFLALALASGVLAQDALQSVVKDARPSVVSITSFGNDGAILVRGSGFFISEAGDVLTRRLILPEGRSRAEVVTFDGKSYPVKRIEAEDKDTGLVRVSVELPKQAVKILKVSTTLPWIGEQVLVISGSITSQQSITEGTVSTIQHSQAGRIIQISGKVAPGSNGSPVINMKGEVVGVTSFKKEGEETFAANAAERIARLYPGVEGVASETPGGSTQEGAREQPSSILRKTGSVLQGSAITRVTPIYPIVAKNARMYGSVIVEVIIDVSGDVVSARAISGSFRQGYGQTGGPSPEVAASALKKAAVEAARQWKFTPTKQEGKPVKVIGTISFNFTP